MNEHGQVYMDLSALIPEADVKRFEEAEREQQERIRELLTDEAASRVEQKIANADRALLHGS